jgi:hypothetical protein
MSANSDGAAGAAEKEAPQVIAPGTPVWVVSDPLGWEHATVKEPTKDGYVVSLPSNDVCPLRLFVLQTNMLLEQGIQTCGSCFEEF